MKTPFIATLLLASLAAVPPAPAAENALTTAGLADAIQKLPARVKAGELKESVDLVRQIGSLSGLTMKDRKQLAAAFQIIHAELARRNEADLLFPAAEHARKLFPGERWSGINLGEAAVRKGDFELAARVLPEAAGQPNRMGTAAPDDESRLNVLLARTWLTLNKLDKARTAADAAIAADPADARGLYLKAQILLRSGDHDQACKLSREAFAKNPKAALPSDYLVRASCLLRGKDFDTARKVMEEAIKQYPTAPGLHFGLGQAFLALQGQSKDNVARAFYQFQHEIMLSGPRSNYTGEAKDQLEILTALIAEEKDNEAYLKVAYGAAAIQYMKPGSYDKAIAEIQKGLRTNGDDCLPLQMLLGQAYGFLGKHEEAIEAFSNLLRIDPAFVPAYVELGHQYLALGKDDQAKEQYARALVIDRANWRVAEIVQFLKDSKSRETGAKKE